MRIRFGVLFLQDTFVKANNYNNNNNSKFIGQIATYEINKILQMHSFFFINT